MAGLCKCGQVIIFYVVPLFDMQVAKDVEIAAEPVSEQ